MAMHTGYHESAHMVIEAREMNDAHTRCVHQGAWLGALVLLVAVAGCTAAPVLRVGSSGDYPPFSYADGDGALDGFDVAAARRFAEDFVHQVELVPFAWPALLDDLEAGKFDVVMSGVTLRADRALHVAYSRPYAVTGAVVVVRRERAAELHSLVAVDRAEVRLAVNRGGHLERVSRERFAHAQLVAVDDNTALVPLLLSGDVDAVVSEEFEARTWPQDRIVVLGPFTRDRKAYAVAPQHVELLAAVNDWLAAREDDGWLAAQRSRWLGPGAAATAEQACFEAIGATIDMRLQLMPYVAAAKRAANQPVEDRQQEERVVDRARGWAEADGLAPDGVAALFRLLIAAAKQIQLAAADAGAGAVDLESLRRAIALQSRQLVGELARCRRFLEPAQSPVALEAALRAGVPQLAQTELDAATLAGSVRAAVLEVGSRVPRPAPPCAHPTGTPKASATLRNYLESKLFFPSIATPADSRKKRRPALPLVTFARGTWFARR